MTGVPAVDGLAPAALELLRAVLPGPVTVVGTELRWSGRRAPIRDGIVRVREEDGYNASFALQWDRFRTNQLDDVNRTRLSQQRFSETRWSREDLNGRLALEAGCGAGRFTRLLAEARACVVAFDYSAAVDVDRQNNGTFPNAAFLQCDIFDMPFREGTFDFVFCHGVLQHTPDPEGAFRRLVRMVRPGGRISIDIYRKDGRVRPWKSKYLWRWLTTRIEPERLLRAVEWYVPKWLPVDTAIKSVPLFGNYLGAIIPCWNYRKSGLSREQLVQWAIMDTFDALAPLHDLPVTREEVRRWFHEADLEEADVRPGGNGVVGNGRRKRDA